MVVLALTLINVDHLKKHFNPGMDVNFPDTLAPAGGSGARRSESGDMRRVALLVAREIG